VTAVVVPWSVAAVVSVIVPGVVVTFEPTAPACTLNLIVGVVSVPVSSGPGTAVTSELPTNFAVAPLTLWPLFFGGPDDVMLPGATLPPCTSYEFERSEKVWRSTAGGPASKDGSGVVAPGIVSVKSLPAFASVGADTLTVNVSFTVTLMCAVPMVA